jgi:hypothetical protein
MAYATAAQVRAKIATRLGMAGPASLPVHWQTLADEAVDDAYLIMRSRLIARGNTSAEIDAWEHRVSWNVNLAVYFAFVNASQAGKDYGDHVDKLKVWLDDLKTVLLLTSTPTAESPRRITTGSRQSADETVPHLRFGAGTYGAGSLPDADLLASDDTTGLSDIPV